MKLIYKILSILIALLLLQIITITQTKAAFFENFTNWLNPIIKVMAEGDEVDPIFTTGVDISKNGDGSVKAILSEDQTTLTITGTGEMENFNSTSTVPWVNYKKEITTVTISKGVTSIGTSAFSGCSSLNSITIPEGVTSIGYSAFSSCSSLSSITIPEEVTSIGTYVFYKCGSLTSIVVDSNNAKYRSEAGILYNKEKTIIIKYPSKKAGNFYIIPGGVTSIGTDAFDRCSILSSIIIPEGVTSIGDDAFYGCSSLSSIKIPGGVTSIGESAFYGCSSLSSIIIPEGVTSIRKYAFDGCSSLSSITIPEGVTSIGYSAFSSCSSLAKIEIPNSVTSIESAAFNGCSSLTSIIIPEGVTSIGTVAFNGCSSLSSIIIPEGVTSIGYKAFEGCSRLSNITIPERVTGIGEFAFNGCSSLSSITIPEGVAIIGRSTFNGCSSLTSIIIPEGVTSIGNDAFKGCNSLINIEIPNSVTSIGNGTFNGCSSLSSIIIPKEVTSIGNDAFSNCNSLTIICKSNTEAENYAKKNEIDYITDDTAPTMTVSPTNATVCKSAEVSITVADNDGGVGLATSNSYQYYLSTSSTTLSGGRWTTYTSGTAFTAGTGLTGTYYLFVKRVNDKVGNTSTTNGVAQEVSGTTYQRFGSYVFDNTAPTIVVSPESVTVCKSTNVTVTVADNDGGAGLSSSNSYQYYLSTSSTTLNGGTWTGYTSGVAFTIGTGITGTRYLFVKRVDDAVGNTSTSNGTVTTINGTTYQRFGSYVFDNTDNTTLNIESTIYKIENNTIGQVQPKTTVKELKTKITTNATTITVIDKDGKNVSEENQVGTGMKITFNGEDTYTLVVTGDTNGDGQANIQDIMQVNKHRLKKAQLTGCYLKAGDVNNDGNVNIQDIMKINKYRLGKISEL